MRILVKISCVPKSSCEVLCRETHLTCPLARHRNFPHIHRKTWFSSSGESCALLKKKVEPFDEEHKEPLKFFLLELPFGVPAEGLETGAVLPRKAVLEEGFVPWIQLK